MLKTKIHPREIYQRSEEFGLKVSADMLTEIIELEKDNNKRKEAIKYLGLIGNNSKPLKSECFETFENLLISDDSVEIKCEAAKALGRIKYEKALKPLKWILDQKPVDYNIEMAVLKAIYKTRFEEPEIRIFINELASTFNSIREYASIRLLSLNPEKLIKLLEPGTAILTESVKDTTIEKPFGIRKLLWDYSIDLVGPSDRAMRQIELCNDQGIPTTVLSMYEMSFEAALLPEIPCMDRWAARADGLAGSGADGPIFHK